MDARAVSARKEWLAPLVDLALLTGLVATPALAIWAGVALPWGFGLLVGAGGVAIVVLVGRARLGAMWALVVAGGTWLTLAVSCFFAFVILLSNCAANLDDPWAPWVGMGIVYAALGLWSLRTGRSLWGLPLAVVLAFVLGLTLVFTLPGTPQVCD